MSFWKDCFTEKDGESFCPVRAGFIAAIIGYFGFTAHDFLFVENLHFIEHAKDWVSGLADLLGFGGAAVAGKSFTEKAE